MNESPYSKYAQRDWVNVTKRLIEDHPLPTVALVKACLESWESIFASRIGKKKIQIGKDIFPKPQTMAFLLHELIPREFTLQQPGMWRLEKDASDKDAVYIPDDTYSMEIKASSSSKKIFGNRSYAQKSTKGKKAKSGYYLAINFESFAKAGGRRPEIRLIRFGWLDSEDWIGQKAPTGQQSRLPSAVEETKLLVIYDSSEKGRLL